MSRYIHRSHNVTVLMYHLVFPTKYRRIVIDDEVDELIKGISLEIEKRYEIHFVEIGTDKDHVHFLVQAVPTIPVSRLVTIIKSITAKEVFRRKPGIKKELWGSSLWTSGYYASTVGKHGNEEVIGRYIKEQGREAEYVQLHKDQLRLL
ncbi:MAG: transposase [Chloroflexi bacterium RBG_13_46_14]|nr:MAG: transposase [Chloroflexi bacterium RBG_13_46_14]